MLESNNFLENLLKIIINPNSIKMQKILSLDILIWICSIRLMRFRSPQQSSDNSPQKSTSSNSNFNSPELSTFDMKIQQQECIAIIEKYLENIIKQCILQGNRNIAHKTVKLILLVSE